MTFRQIIQGFIRTFILTSISNALVTDIATNGLTPADEVIIDAFLDQTAP